MFSTIARKLGGTSVGSVQQISLMANRILQEKNKGHDVIVVSAMGKTGDALLQLKSCPSVAFRFGAGFYS